jgi:hypothetical protein
VLQGSAIPLYSKDGRGVPASAAKVEKKVGGGDRAENPPTEAA